ncbi:tail fiber protein [Sphingorhabdus sp. Alg239-R122]|uniref:phage tail protein n=1 Tax=Sphingorhabdus sp. Alg239-R122 TaxID=2305989 RepID=UPI0013DB14C1|nr:tail fiber protein [Sphingorhabdus sp. Alg239-R122]
MSIKYLLASSAIISASLCTTAPAYAGTDAYIGEITPVGFTFCPRATTDANGQLLAISQNTALFSLYGTTYGGDGRTTFALPDLRGRAPIHTGTGPGLSPRTLGSRSGTETNTMTVTQMPSHNHQGGIQTTNQAANSKNAKSDAFGIAQENTYVDGATPSGNFMNASTFLIGNTGGGQAQNNMQPFLTIRYCVVLQGIFPSRN